MLRQDVPDPSHVEGDRQRYQGPDTSEARTDYVLGEFYWRVRVGDVANIEQYQAGSTFLVKEVTGEEIVWSRGFKVPTGEVRAAFKLAPDPTVARSGSHLRQTIFVLVIGVIACVFLTCLDAVFRINSDGHQVFYQKYDLTAADRGRTVASAPFTLPDRRTNTELILYSPVHNDWVSLNISLVADGGTPAFDAASTIEYYTGFDSDGAWDEGSQQSEVLFRRVPGGTYRLLVEADAGAFGEALPAPRSQNFADVLNLADITAPLQDKPVAWFSITVKGHVPAPELYWIGLLLIVPYPLYRLFFRRGPT
jgi:hypothetical protein